MPHRNYRAGTALAHVLGYMNEITQEELARLNGDGGARAPALRDGRLHRPPRRGAQLRGSVLRGTDGWVKQVVNARGEVMRDATGDMLQRDEVPPRPGNNVVLSIDARLQAEAERVFPGTAGAIVAMEAKTGFVLAMVSRPSFDPNEMTGRVSPARLAAAVEGSAAADGLPRRRRALPPGLDLQGGDPPGGAALGGLHAQTTVTCGGGYRLGSRRWRCHKESGHGPVHAHTALQ